ncbi:hypothetical protein [Janthinobacterium sp.]|uniref:hypothetical protein n=1 Tax=Janthinobacterium sp. TaxID=1871054 RepID=UPI00293D955A|nr:hypothetical protein [Janthinobacterium sp.]
MSIALSVRVRPAVRLRFASAALSLCAIAAGLALALARGGDFLGAPVGACASGLGGLACLLRPVQDGMRRRLDISAVGQIRLTVYQHMGEGAAATRSASLMPGSTLWPGFLLLRLRLEDGAVLVLALWRGNVGGAAFRSLAVACRAIAARGGGME